MPLTATTSTWTWAAGVSAGDLARYFPCYRTLESALLQPIQDRSDLVALHQGRHMSTLRKFKDPGARPPPLHLARSLCGQELRAAAAQYENRLCYRLPIAPEIHVTAERACKAAPDGRIVVAAPAPIGHPDERSLDKTPPFLLRKRTETFVGLTKISAGALEIRPDPFLCDLRGNLLECSPRKIGTDVVQDEAPQGALGLCREQHPDDAAHGGAEPIHLLHIQTREQRVHVLQILWEIVARGLRQGIAVAAAHHVWADHTPAFLACRGSDLFEIPAVARKTMDADQNPLRLGRPPLPVGQAVEAAHGKAEVVLQARLAHGRAPPLDADKITAGQTPGQSGSLREAA